MSGLELSEPVNSESDVETRHLMLDGARVGVVKAYRATGEEAKLIGSKMKKRVKPGQTFSVKVFLDKEADDKTIEEMAARVRALYSDLVGKVYFVMSTGDGIIPLGMR